MGWGKAGGQHGFYTWSLCVPWSGRATPGNEFKAAFPDLSCCFFLDITSADETLLPAHGCGPFCPHMAMDFWKHQQKGNCLFLTGNESLILQEAGLQSVSLVPSPSLWVEQQAMTALKCQVPTPSTAHWPTVFTCRTPTGLSSKKFLHFALCTPNSPTFNQTLAWDLC